MFSSVTYARTYVRTYVRTHERTNIIPVGCKCSFGAIYIMCMHFFFALDHKNPKYQNFIFLNTSYYTLCNIPFRNECQDHCSKGALTPNRDDVRTYARTYVRTYVTLENIVHSISPGRTVTKCRNLVCVCNKYQ